MKLNHEYVPTDHECTCPCHGGAKIFEYLPCCQYEGMLRSPDGPFKKIVIPMIKDIEMKPLFEGVTDEDWKKSAADSSKVLQNVFDLVRKMSPSRMAEEICGVQPMPTDLMEKAMAGAKDEKWLIENGYEPVSDHRLMWIKKEKSDEQVGKED